MTVTVIRTQKVYVGAPPAFTWAIDFPFWDLDEIEVWVRNTAAGTSVQQVKDSDYTITGGDGSTGQVLMGLADVNARADITTGETVHLVRVSKQDQQVDLTPAVDVPTATIEQALDRQTLRLQESKDRTDSRALTIPFTDLDTAGNYPAMELPDKAARGVTGAYLAFNSSGEPVIATASVPVASTSAFGDTWILLADAAAGRANIDAVFDRDGSSFSAVQAGTEATRAGIAAVTFGTGLFYTTDTRRLWYSDASTWVEAPLGQYAHASLPAAATAGRIFLDTGNLELLRDSGSALVPLRAPFARGALGGSKTSRGTATRIDVAAGEARAHLGNASIQGRNLYYSSGFTKLIGAADSWVVGSGNLGMAPSAGVAHNTWFYVFMIANAAGVEDMAIDNNPSGTNILSAGAIVTAGYDQHIRRVGRFRTNATGSGEIIDFVQDNDEFLFVDPTTLGLAYSQTAQDFTAGVAITLSTADVSCISRIRISTAGTMANEMMLEETRVTSGAPSQTAAPLHQMSTTSHRAIELILKTDSSRQIRARTTTDASVNLHIQQLGWFDYREKDA